MRWLMTGVLQDPGPSRMRCGASPWVTAAICSGLGLRSSSWETDFYTPGVCPRGEGEGKAAAEPRSHPEVPIPRKSKQGLGLQAQPWHASPRLVAGKPKD